MSDPTVYSVVGSDGHHPVYLQNERWHNWALSEIWLGPDEPGQNKYVPKVLDYVTDPATFTTWIVDVLDSVTYTPTLRPIRPSYLSTGFSQTDLLFSQAPGMPAQTMQMCVDKSVMPYHASPEGRLYMYTQEVAYAKVFKGTDITSPNARVISRIYDVSGNVVSENVPMQNVALDNHTNYHVKAMASFKTVEDLAGADLVTVVFYRNDGSFVSAQLLTVKLTSFVRDLNVSQKYIDSIELLSPFLDPTDNHRVQLPINLTVNSSNFVGVVNYSDGDRQEFPVDGTRFRLNGLDGWAATIEGHRTQLQLVYNLQPGEISMHTSSSLTNAIVENYEIVATNPNMSYSCKLFVYPVWVNPTAGYSLRWYMTTMDRNIVYDVTPYVVLSPLTGGFDPKGYGVLQRKQVSVNLQNVNPSFVPFTHVQTVDITLYGQASNNVTDWEVKHTAISGSAFGVSTYATKEGTNAINLSSGASTYEQWKTKFYTNTDPQRTSFEDAAPTPTHFVFSYGAQSLELPVDQWDQDIPTVDNIPAGANVGIKFIRRLGAQVTVLSMASVMVKTL